MSIVLAQELKGLQSRLEKAKGDQGTIRQAVSIAQKQLAAANKEVIQLEQQIRNLQEQASNPIVTEHAMLRWLERIEGRSLEDLCETILDPATVSQIKFAGGNCVIQKANGPRLIVKNNAIVTVE